ncbi:hypothetical protein BOO92_21360 [Vibrio navarrensis]|nr:hypothetical protein [Vibrio navarrensis]
MIFTRGSKAVIWMGAICLLHLVFMLVFRVSVYAEMYIAPDAPYGLSDIIELFLYMIFLILLSVSIFLLIRGSSQSKKSGFLLVLFCITLYQVQGPLHQYAAKLGG